MVIVTLHTGRSPQTPSLVGYARSHQLSLASNVSDGDLWDNPDVSPDGPRNGHPKVKGHTRALRIEMASEAMPVGLVRLVDEGEGRLLRAFDGGAIVQRSGQWQWTVVSSEIPGASRTSPAGK